MIPTYRQAHLVGTAISSALSQDYERLEVVVIDDASPDSTSLVVRDFEGDRRFRYIRNPRNLGRVRNYRHALYDIASGDYVLNLDGDDWLTDPTYISRAIEAIDANPGVVLAFATAGTVNETTGVTDDAVPVPGPPLVVKGRELLARYADGALGIAHLTALYSRVAAIKAGFYSFDVIGSDTLSMLLLAAEGPMVYIPRRVACWRQHGRNASVEPNWRVALQNLAVANVPAQRFMDTGFMSKREAAIWRTKVAALLARQQLGQYVSGRKIPSAVFYLCGLLATRPAAVALLARPGVAFVLRAFGKRN